MIQNRKFLSESYEYEYEEFICIKTKQNKKTKKIILQLLFFSDTEYRKFLSESYEYDFYFLLFSFQFQANSYNWDVFFTDNYNIIMSYDLLLQKV